MKNSLQILIVILLASTTLLAQSKIKGDRNVTIKQTYIDEFSSIVLDGDFGIEIVYNSKPSVTVEADNNLHDVIALDVVDGVLTIKETLRITSKKKLSILVNYGTTLQHIELRGDTELRSLTLMELNEVSLTTLDNSRAYLNIKAKSFVHTSSGKSKTRLNLSADSSKVVLNDTAKLEALINSNVADFDLYMSAYAVIEGTASNATIRLEDNTNFNSPLFDIKAANAFSEGNSDLIISSSEQLTLAASGESEIYLYGNPEVTLTKFEDTAKLQKKRI